MKISFYTEDLGVFNKAMLSLMDGKPRKIQRSEGDRRVIDEGVVTDISSLVPGKRWRIMLQPIEGAGVASVGRLLPGRGPVAVAARGKKLKLA